MKPWKSCEQCSPAKLHREPFAIVRTISSAETALL
jgi:hypothetical protein